MPWIAGVTGFDCNVPPMDCVPCNGGADSSACTVTVTVAALLFGCQVALQRPSLSELSCSAGSPFEKDATTLPAVRRFPQSSTTVASIGVGQAATVENPTPSCVNTGISFFGTQLPDAWGCIVPSRAVVEPAGVIISKTATCRVLASENWIPTSPR